MVLPSDFIICTSNHYDVKNNKVQCIILNLKIGLTLIYTLVKQKPLYDYDVLLKHNIIK